MQFRMRFTRPCVFAHNSFKTPDVRVDVRVDVLAFAINTLTMFSRPTVKCKRQTPQVKRHMSNDKLCEQKNHQVSVVKQSVSVRHFWFFRIDRTGKTFPPKQVVSKYAF